MLYNRKKTNSAISLPISIPPIVIVQPCRNAIKKASHVVEIGPPGAGMSYGIIERLKQEPKDRTSLSEGKIKPIPVIIRLNTRDKEVQALWFKLICPRHCKSATEIISTGRQEPRLIVTDREPGRPRRFADVTALSPVKYLQINRVQRYLQDKVLTRKRPKIHNSTIQDSYVYCPGDCSICEYAAFQDQLDTVLSFQTHDTKEDDIRK